MDDANFLHTTDLQIDEISSNLQFPLPTPEQFEKRFSMVQSEAMEMLKSLSAPAAAPIRAADWFDQNGEVTAADMQISNTHKAVAELYARDMVSQLGLQRYYMPSELRSWLQHVTADEDIQNEIESEEAARSGNPLANIDMVALDQGEEALRRQIRDVRGQLESATAQENLQSAYGMLVAVYAKFDKLRSFSLERQYVDNSDILKLGTLEALLTAFETLETSWEQDLRRKTLEKKEEHDKLVDDNKKLQLRLEAALAQAMAIEKKQGLEAAARDALAMRLTPDQMKQVIQAFYEQKDPLGPRAELLRRAQLRRRLVNVVKAQHNSEVANKLALHSAHE
eukprot:PhF_6_TR551/c1_g2_i3/m.508